MWNRCGVAAGVLVLLGVAGPGVLAADEAKPATTTDGSQGFVTFKSGDNALTLGAWAQFRATVDDREKYDGDTAGSGVGKEDGTVGSLSIPRLRFYMQGTVYRPWLRYKFELELASLKTDATNNINNGRITDGYVEFAKSPYATLRAGQYKVPFGLQELTSDWRQEFVERSIASAKFAPSRDVGLMLTGQFFKNKLMYQIAGFNGAGQNDPQEDRAFMYAGRLVYDPFGEYKPIESATENPEKNILHFGLAYRFGEVPKGTATAGVFTNVNDENAAAFEVAWKYRRFFAVGEYYQQTDEQQNPAVGPDVDARGYYAQFGVMVAPKTQELAVRYSEVEPDKSVSDAKQTELRLVYGYFWKSHNMKLQADIGQIGFGKNFSTLSGLALRNVSPGLSAAQRLVALPGEAITDNQLRVQFVVAF
jgi:phosphate-selective porin OprO/OprP